jgi:hypothetical protein
MTMIRAPRFLLPVLAVAAACASAPPPPPKKTAPQAGVATDLPNGFYLAMKANDATAAGQRFSDELKQSLPPERLREMFDTLRSQLGNLRWWQPTAEYRQGDSTKLVYRLEFDRGTMSGLVTVDLGAEQIVSVQFLPPG